MVNRKSRNLPDAPNCPWKTLDSPEVYANPWLAVVEHTVVRPDGSTGIYGVVDPGDNVTIAALNAANEVLLVQDFVYPVQQWAWSLPSGAIEPDEQPQPAAVRELAEEGGIVATTWQLLTSVWLTAGISPQTSYCFMAQNLAAIPARPEPTEVISRQWLPLTDAIDWCKDGKIRHANTVLTLLWMYDSLRNP